MQRLGNVRYATDDGPFAQTEGNSHAYRMPQVCSFLTVTSVLTAAVALGLGVMNAIALNTRGEEIDVLSELNANMSTKVRALESIAVQLEMDLNKVTDSAFYIETTIGYSSLEFVGSGSYGHADYTYLMKAPGLFAWNNTDQLLTIPIGAVVRGITTHAFPQNITEGNCNAYGSRISLGLYHMPPSMDEDSSNDDGVAMNSNRFRFREDFLDLGDFTFIRSATPTDFDNGIVSMAGCTGTACHNIDGDGGVKALNQHVIAVVEDCDITSGGFVTTIGFAHATGRPM
jgi:hypothetical protein